MPPGYSKDAWKSSEIFLEESRSIHFRYLSEHPSWQHSFNDYILGPILTLKHFQYLCQQWDIQNAPKMPKCCQVARMSSGRQNVARTPKHHLDAVKTLPGYHQDARLPLRHSQDTWMSLGYCQDAARMPLGRCQTTDRKPGLVSKKVLTLTKWLLQLMNCVVSKCKFCALFYLLLSNLLSWNGL